MTLKHNNYHEIFRILGAIPPELRYLFFSFDELKQRMLTAEEQSDYGELFQNSYSG